MVEIEIAKHVANKNILSKIIIIITNLPKLVIATHAIIVFFNSITYIL
jgi:hypothetical protein